MNETNVRIEIDAREGMGCVYIPVFLLCAHEGVGITAIMAFTDRPTAEDHCGEFKRVTPERTFVVIEIHAYVKQE